ncbi:MAG TPA: YraN family protein [Rhizomicrobium sp.]|nr:YraN family protein [Rhizomicrobium sp.]
MKSADTVSRRAAERAGRRSELLASLFLLLKGYRILGRRVRTRAGEIDLIVRSLSGVLCFVEVKARERADTALEAVRFRQQGRIGRAAELYLALNPHLGRKGVRFDLVTVGGRGLPRHFPAAFHPEDWRGNAA